MVANSCIDCLYCHWVEAHPLGTSASGWECSLTGGHALGRCDGFREGAQDKVGYADDMSEHRIIAVSPEAEGAFVALASAMGYQVRKVNP